MCCYVSFIIDLRSVGLDKILMNINAYDAVVYFYFVFIAALYEFNPYSQAFYEQLIFVWS